MLQTLCDRRREERQQKFGVGGEGVAPHVDGNDATLLLYLSTVDHEGAPPGSANAVSCRSMPNTGAAAFPCHTYIHSTLPLLTFVKLAHPLVHFMLLLHLPSFPQEAHQSVRT